MMASNPTGPESVAESAVIAAPVKPAVLAAAAQEEKAGAQPTSAPPSEIAEGEWMSGVWCGHHRPLLAVGRVGWSASECARALLGWPTTVARCACHEMWRVRHVWRVHSFHRRSCSWVRTQTPHHTHTLSLCFLPLHQWTHTHKHAHAHARAHTHTHTHTREGARVHSCVHVRVHACTRMTASECGEHPHCPGPHCTSSGRTLLASGSSLTHARTHAHTASLTAAITTFSHTASHLTARV
jgi:hypothetical protein